MERRSPDRRKNEQNAAFILTKYGNIKVAFFICMSAIRRSPFHTADIITAIGPA